MFSVLISALFLSTLPFSSAWEPSNPFAPYSSYQARNLATIQKIYNRTVYPNSLAFSINGSASVPAGLFAANASGRITPVGNFTGFKESVEYFFGLQPYGQPPLYTIFNSADVVAFSSSCPQVASSVVYFNQSIYHPGASNDGQFLTKLKQIAFWRFDSTGAVVAYDAWIPNLQAYTNKFTLGLDPYSPLPAFVQDYEIASLCQTTQQNCVGTNKQYSSQAECEQVLKSKPFGSYDETWGDNIVCRTVHILLTTLDPVVHCPHVGPTGGSKCANITYNDEYFQDTVLFGNTEANTFICTEKEWASGYAGWWAGYWGR